MGRRRTRAGHHHSGPRVSDSQMQDVPRVRAEFTSRFVLHNVARWSPTTCILILNKHHIHRLLFSLCRGIIHRGEFGISDAIMRAGYNIATLMAKYPKVWHRPTDD